MTYRIEFTRSSAKQLQSLPAKARERIQTKLLILADNPRSFDTIKLENQGDLYRVRVGNYRIIYQIQDDELIVLVVKIAHRREAYR
jgi:mRNA interferase RelE/StbE